MVFEWFCNDHKGKFNILRQLSFVSDAFFVLSFVSFVDYSTTTGDAHFYLSESFPRDFFVNGFLCCYFIFLFFV